MTIQPEGGTHEVEGRSYHANAHAAPGNGGARRAKLELTEVVPGGDARPANAERQSRVPARPSNEAGRDRRTDGSTLEDRGFECAWHRTRLMLITSTGAACAVILGLAAHVV